MVSANSCVIGQNSEVGVVEAGSCFQGTFGLLVAPEQLSLFPPE